MKRVLLVFLLCIVGLSASAEDDDSLGIIRRTVRGFDRLDNAYIEPQHYEFTVMAQLTRTYENFAIASNNQSITLAPDGLTKIGPYVGWRWFFLGYTFDIKNIGFSQNGLRKEFDLSIYTSQVGIDIFYRRTGNDYKIRDVRLGRGIDGSLFEGVPFDGVNVGITGASAYYIFNHGKFSYPAAFSQSTCQKISCGSWLAGIGFTKNTLSMDYDKLELVLKQHIDRQHELKLDSGMMFHDIEYNDFIIFCASGQLAACYKSSNGQVADEKSGFSFDKVNLDGIGRFGLVYNNTRWYAGCSAILRTNNYRTPRFKANNIFGSLNFYVGYNFMLKKKYRKA